MIFKAQPNDPWEPFDFALIEAYQILQDEICPQCGNYIWLCRSSDPNVHMSVTTTVCQGDRAVQEYKNKQIADPKQRAKDAKANRKTWGHFFSVRAEPVIPGTSLPTRADYYAEKASLVQ